MKRSLLGALALVCVLSLVLTACGATPAPTVAPTKASEPTKAPAVAPTTAPAGAPAAFKCPKTGGVYTFNYSLPADRFGVPKSVVGYNQFYQNLVMEGFFSVSNDDLTQYVPRLALSWVLAPDKSSYTFKLRQGVKFHDGSDFNAEVAKWNLDNWINAKLPQLDKAKSVDIIDNYTIRVNLSGWDATVFNDFGAASAMISKKSFEANGEEWANTHPIGTGLWRLKSFDRGQKVVLERFPDYWNKDVGCLAGIEILQVPDPMTALAMIKKGDVQALYQTDAQTAYDLRKSDPKYKVDAFGGPHNVIIMNTTDPASVWSDIRMRQALEYAVDKQSIVDATGFGFARTMYEIIHSINDTAAKPGTTPRKYDLAKAKALIAEAGHSKGLDVKLTISANLPKDPFVALQRNLADVGINVTLDPVSEIALNQMSRQPSKGSDLMIQPQRGGLPDPINGVKEVLTAKSVYFPSLKRPAGFDDLYQKALMEEDFAKRLALLAQMEKLAYDDVMFVPLWAAGITTVDNGALKGVFWSYAGRPNARFDWAYLP